MGGKSVVQTIIQLSLREITIEYPAVIPLLNKYQIDFYCNGKEMLSKSLDENFIDKDVFFKEFIPLIKSKNQFFPVNINLWPLDLMADYIEKTHHRFTEDVLLKIKRSFNSYNESNSNSDDNELFEIFIALSKELGGHMKKEELVLFPFIRKMVNRRGDIERPRFATVENPIAMMEHEHIVASELIQIIRIKTDNYSNSNIKDSNYIYFTSLLKDLDNDLIYHLHIENNILFPMAIEMEKRIFV